MAKVNVERVKTFIGEIKQSRGFLRELTKFSKENVVGDPLRLGSVRYYLIAAIQSSADLCTHLAAKCDARAPEDYGDCFKVLAEIGVLSADLSERMIRMAKLRNLLIHRYRAVDNLQIYGLLLRGLDVFDEFAKTIADYALVSMEGGE